MSEGGATALFGTQISLPGRLDLSRDTAERWKLWKQMWDNYSIVTQLKEIDNKYQTALFLHSAGPDALKIFNGFQFTEQEDPDDLQTLIDKFDQHIIGQTNETYERYIFNKRDQDNSESIDSYVTVLRTLAKSCNFCECLHDSLIRGRLVLGVRDNQARKRLLQQGTLFLRQCIDICRSSEATTSQMKAMGVMPDSFNKVKQNYNPNLPNKHNKGKKQPNRGNSKQTQSHGQISCKFCGRRHEKKKEVCPAWGKVCNSCGLKNHFESKCPNKPDNRVNQVNTDREYSDSKTEFVFGVKSKASVASVGLESKKEVSAYMLVDGKPVCFQIDSGATVNILPKKYVVGKPITHHGSVLQMWNGTELSPLGKCRVILRNPKNRKKYSVEFIIVRDSFKPLLGKFACEQMGLINVNYDRFSVASIVSTSCCEQIVAEYADVFEGELGTLPDKVQLHVDESITSHTSAPGRIPVALVTRFKTELDRLQQLGVIAPVDEPTDWNSRMVVAEKKNGDLRLCIAPDHSMLL